MNALRISVPHRPCLNPPGARDGGIIIKLLIGLASLVILLVIAAAIFGPAIIASLLPGIIESRVNPGMKGSVQIRDVSLSWGGPQKIESIRLIDPDGGEAASVSVEANRGLWGLARSGGDFGTILVQADANVTRRADGMTNIQAAVASTKPAQPGAPGGGAGAGGASGGGVSLPENLRITIELQSSNITFSEGGRSTSLRDIQGKAEFQPGGTLDATLTADSPDQASGKAIDIAINASKLVDASNQLQLDKAEGTLKANAALSDQTMETIARVLGGELPEQMRGVGAMQADVDLEVRDGVLELAQADQPGTISTSVGAGVLPAGGAHEAPIGFAITNRPGVTLRLDQLRVPLPKAGAAPDWRGTAFQLALTTEAIEGRITQQREADAEPSVRSVRIEPSETTLATNDLAQGISLRSSLDTNFEGSPAGTLNANLMMQSPLDDEGAMRPFWKTFPGGLRGDVEAQNVPTPLVESLANVTGADLEQAIGSSLAARLRFTAREGESDEPSTAGRVPPTTIEARVNGQFASARAELEYAESAIRSRGQGITLDLMKPAALLPLAMGESQIETIGDGRVKLLAPEFALPFENGSPDYRNATANLHLISGNLGIRPTPGDLPVNIDELEAWGTLKSGGRLSMRATGKGTYDGKEMTLDADGQANDLIAFDQESGAPSVRLQGASPKANATLTNLPVSLARIISPEAHEWTSAAVGETINEATIALTTPSQGTIALDVNATAPRAELNGDLRYAKDRIALGEGGMTLFMPDAEPLLNKVLTGDTPPGDDETILQVRSADAATLRIERFDIPVDESGGPNLRQLRLKGTISASNAALVEQGPKRADGTRPVREYSSQSISGTVNIEPLTTNASGNAHRPFDAKITAAPARMAASEAKPILFETAEVGMQSTDVSNQVGVSLDALAYVEGQSVNVDNLKPLTARGTIDYERDEQGKPIGDSAALTASVTGEAPTLLFDVFAEQGGLLVDVIGPRASVDLTTTRLTRGSGSLSGQLQSDRASASITGDAREATFAVTEPARVALTRVTPELSDRIFETVLPILNRFEKTERDDPSVVTASNLIVPLDKDLSKLSGVFDVDLGTMQFEASTLFSKLLKATHNNAIGQVGQRIEPFQVRVESGVVKYDRIPIPTGEFMLETRGNVDLPQKRLDVIVYVPLFALVEELAAVTSKVPGLDRTAMIPLRISGPSSKPKTEVALDLMIEEGLPGLIEKNIGNVLDGLFNGGRKKDEEKK